MLLGFLKSGTSQLLNEMNDFPPCHSIIFQVSKSNEFLEVDPVQLSGEHTVLFVPGEVLQIKGIQSPHLLRSLLRISDVFVKSLPGNDNDPCC